VAHRYPARKALRTRSTVLAALAVLGGGTLVAVPAWHTLATGGGQDGHRSSPYPLPLPMPMPHPPAGPDGATRSDGPSGPGVPEAPDSPALPGSIWPASGQAAFVESTTGGKPRIQAGPNQHPAPIASVTKVMTAYLVLRDHPLKAGEDGPVITLTSADAADTAHRRAMQQSVVAITAGERLTERQALEALLLPSANNIAAVLATWDAGSQDRFVEQMNAAASPLGMADTRYTDPSGFDPDTVSTAADQVRIIEAAMALPAFAGIVAMPSAALPVAGTVANTDTLLGHDGFVGVKTGSDNAAGGCFAFRAVRRIGGKDVTITGVVLGQPGADQIAAGLGAARGLVDRIAGSPL
jgi:D-alanyl-D-alanine carboxypeptidase (penicillin-binding protein 5/6)